MNVSIRSGSVFEDNRPCPVCGGKLEYSLCIDVAGLMYHCTHCGKFFWETEIGVLEDTGITPVLNNTQD